MQDELKTLLIEFQKRLNAMPDDKELEDTPDGKAKTLPISFVEMTLDEIFLGHWETTKPSYQQIFNEIVATVELTVWHPHTGKSITRTGWASIVITQDKDAKIADFNSTKKKNALDLAFPKLGAEAVKNAAKSLGKIFGRDVNRKKADTYKPAYKPLSDEGFKALTDRIQKGDNLALDQARAYFTFDAVQQSILDGLTQKQLN